MIRNDYKHTIYDRAISSTELPIVSVKSNSTAYGSVQTAYGFTGIQPSLYQLGSPTGAGDPYIQVGTDLLSSDNLFYTGLNKRIDWQFDPSYVVIDGVTGAQHGQLFGLSLNTDVSSTADTKKYSPDIVIHVLDNIANYGLTGITDPYVATVPVSSYVPPTSFVYRETHQDIYDRSIKDSIVLAKSDESIYGNIDTPTSFTTVEAKLYAIGQPTGMGDPWILLGSDVASSDCVSYTGLNDRISWTVDPNYIVAYGDTGAQDGQNYVLRLLTDTSSTSSTKKYVYDIVINIDDDIRDYGITGPTSYNVYQGPQGVTGIGYVGSDGSTGLQGVTGLSGGASSQGATGVAGIDGSIGNTGIQGVTGLSGTASSQGATGVAGQQGVTGLSGINGEDGSVGFTGLQGQTGLHGITGLIGATGSQGLGITGLIGTTGLQGTNGSIGQTGSQGVTGLSGAASSQGDTGIAGQQGVTGLSGIGTTGSQGATGLRGLTGLNGTNGSQGATGLSLAGFTGLQGFTGLSGTQGATGVNGVTGLSGTTGSQGVTGLTGSTGFQGVTGLQGSGATGIQGTTGLQGVTGAAGLVSSPMTSEIDLGENAGFVLDAALSADGRYSGISENGTAGVALVFGDLVYFQTTDSRWELASADNAAAGHNLKLGICILAAAGDGSATKVLLLGKVRADAVFPTFTIGAPVYMSTTAGDVQVAAPSSTTDIIRKVGFGNTADELYFNPSNDFIELV